MHPTVSTRKLQGKFIGRVHGEAVLRSDPAAVYFGEDVLALGGLGRKGKGA